VRRDCFSRFCREKEREEWIPAYAGMTEKGGDDNEIASLLSQSLPS